MPALATSLYPGWHSFWDALEEAECPWARSISEDGQESFQQTVESMIRASVPRVRTDRLRELWESLRLPALSGRCDHNLRWNLLCDLEQSPFDTDDAEVERVLVELARFPEESEMDSERIVSADLKDRTALFLAELKYTALCTLWHFTGSWSCYTATLPREVLDHLRGSLFGLTVIELICQLP